MLRSSKRFSANPARVLRDVVSLHKKGNSLHIQRLLLSTTVAAFLMFVSNPGHAQVIGSYDNFDCFNDTGETAEGFEIDVEDISSTDLTREFPSNFSSTPWVIRYGLPSLKAYDWTVNAPDAQHSYDAGHKGVLITWAATWNGTQWIAAYGSQPFGGTTSGNGTPFVAKPTYTNGDSCWFYGLGNAYPASGCDHFGISFAPGVAYGKINYHWQIPDPTTPGTLVNGQTVASIPPSPNLNPLPNQPDMVHAVAEAPENPEPVWGKGYWVKVTTLYGKQDALLDNLQKANIKKVKGTKSVHWTLLQRPPVNDPQGVEKDDVEDDQVAGANVQVTKQYEYWAYKGAVDSGTHEVLCGVVAVGKFPDCTQPYTKTYTVIDPETGLLLTAKGGDQGTYLGAHLNAYNKQ